MRYHNITKDDMLNGDGLRVVLWVAGCNHGCKGCQNPITWDPCGGLPFTEREKKEIFQELDKSYISGITFSGGDPLYPANVQDVTALASKTIWLYTGSLWKDVKDLEIVRYLDVLVDGKFVESLKDVNLAWRGSGNQKVIDVPSTLKEGKIVLQAE